MSTMQRLHEIPDLALEAVMTIDHPNPSATTGQHRHTKSDSAPAPTNLHALTLLAATTDPDPDHRPPITHRHGATPDEMRAVLGDQDDAGPLMTDLLMAVRVIVEEHPDSAPAWPDHTWSAICAWLRDTALLWDADRFTREWVDETVRRVWQALRQLVRAPREVRYVCPTCGDTMRLQSGQRWFLCDSGHQTEADAPIRREPAQPTADICKRFQITEDTLKGWRKRGKITPASNGRGRGVQSTWWPWDVYLILNPAIADAIEQCDTQGAG